MQRISRSSAVYQGGGALGVNSISPTRPGGGAVVLDAGTLVFLDTDQLLPE
jgi:hypothetical protein